MESTPGGDMPNHDRSRCRSVEVRLLGAPAWRCPPDGDWAALPDRLAVLLGMLALDGPLQSDETACRLWRDSRVSAMARRLACERLRQRRFQWARQIGHELTRSDGPLLHLAAGVEVDSRDLAAPGQPPGSPLFGTLDPSDLDYAGRQWVVQARGQRMEAWRARQLARAASAEAAGNLVDAAAALQAAMVADPGDEEACSRLMTYLCLLGRRSAAALAYDGLCATLARAGREPNALTIEFRASVDPAAALPRVPLLPAPQAQTPFVGRIGELSRMASAWAQGRAFLLVGAAGIGKSRLLREFGSGRAGTVAVSAAEGDALEPYATARRWLERCRPLAGDPESAEERRELSRVLPGLGDAPPADGREPALLRVLTAVLERAQRGSLVALLVDNLHQADAASCRLLLHGLESLPGLRFGLAMRDHAETQDLQERLARSSAHVVTVPLPGLTPAELADWLHRAGLAGPDPAALARHCGGNPLFVQETLRDWGLQPVHDGTLPVPDSVGGLIRQKLTGLSPAAWVLARWAAVAGPEFAPALVADLAGQDLSALDTPLQELEAAGVFVGPRFAHDLMRETVARGLTEAAARPYHERLAAGLAARAAAPERIAFHAFRAGAWAAAALAAEAAAGLARRVGQHALVLEHLRLARRAWIAAGRPADADRAAQAALHACLMHEGPDAAEAEAQRLRLAASSPAGRAGIDAERTRIALWAGRAALAEAAALAVLEVADAAPDARVMAQAGLAVALAWKAEPAEAVAVIEPLLAHLERLPDPALQRLVLAAFGSVLAQQDHWPRCESVLRQACALAQRDGDLGDQADLSASLAVALGAQGRLEEAVAQAGDVTHLNHLLGQPLGERANEVNLGNFLIGLGRCAQAIPLLQDVIAFARGQPAFAMYATTAEDLLAEAWIALGRFDLAAPLLVEEPPAEPPTRRPSRLELRARLAVLTGDPLAAALWQQALDAAAHPSVNPARQLRARAHASLLMAPDLACRTCDDGLAEALRAHSPVSELLLRLRRAQARLRAGRVAEAADDMRRALTMDATVRSLLVPRPELLMAGFTVLGKAGDAAAAATCLAAGRRWLAEVAAQLPSEADRRALLHGHPVHHALMSA
jgi:hypothetical protein